MSHKYRRKVLTPRHRLALYPSLSLPPFFSLPFLTRFCCCCFICPLKKWNFMAATMLCLRFLSASAAAAAALFIYLHFQLVTAPMRVCVCVYVCKLYNSYSVAHIFGCHILHLIWLTILRLLAHLHGKSGLWSTCCCCSCFRCFHFLGVFLL